MGATDSGIRDPTSGELGRNAASAQERHICQPAQSVVKPPVRLERQIQGMAVRVNHRAVEVNLLVHTVVGQQSIAWTHRFPGHPLARPLPPAMELAESDTPFSAAQVPLPHKEAPMDSIVKHQIAPVSCLAYAGAGQDI